MHYMPHEEPEVEPTRGVRLVAVWGLALVLNIILWAGAILVARLILIALGR